MKTTAFRCACVLALCAWVASMGTAASLDLQLKPEDHKGLSKAVSEYFKAREGKKGESDKLVGLQQAIDEVSKKRLKKGPEALSLSQDWQQVFLGVDKSPSGAKKGTIVEFEFTNRDGSKAKYTLSVPKSYAPDKPMRALLCVPDQGIKAREYLEQHWKQAELLESTLVAVCEMPADIKSWNLLQGGGLGQVLLTLRDLRTNYAVDLDRIFVAGHGLGASTAFQLAGNFPAVFAGVIARGGDIDMLSARNFRNLPTFLSGGGSNADAFKAESEKLGYANCTSEPEFSEDSLWRWMQGLSRNVMPTKVSLSPLQLSSGGAYWIEARGFEVAEATLLEASIDAGANTIRIVSQGVSQANLLLCDALLDLSKPVTVIVNGVEHQELVTRNLKTMLDSVFYSGDARLVYTFAKVYDMSAKAQ